MWPSLIALLAAVALFTTTPARACDGDCDGDGAVSIDELIAGVQIALAGVGLERCTAVDRDGDGEVSITDLIAAVEAALNGCATPTVTPIATPTATPAATATDTPDPGLANCGDGAVNGSEECDDGGRVSGDGCSATCQLEPGGNPCAGVPSSPGVQAATVLVTDGLEQPVHVNAPRLDPRRLFIVEQAGRIRIVKDGSLLGDAFLAIENRVSCCGERGLLSVAFHPDFETNGRFFVDYTNRSGDTVIARYQVGPDPERADRDSERILLTIEQPFANHNGGQLAFGPDGSLYVGMGDGGSGGDPFNYAQNDDSLLGKLLRVDVDVDDPPYRRVPPDNPHADRGDPLGLIWAKGLRNPWRFSFDRATDDLYIGDVGQNRFEEIDVQAAGSRGDENYGWRIFEGDACHDPRPASSCPNPATGLTFPVLAYDHDSGCSVTGGFVYRGCALPDLRGQYFFSDYCTPFIQTFVLANGMVTDLQDRTTALAPGRGRRINGVVSFGEDARGELYIADYDGEVYKVVPAGQ